MNATQTPTWAKRDERIYTRQTERKIGLSRYSLAFRIDGREGSYRVDFLGTMGQIWEAIDGGDGFSSVAKAKAFVSRWIELAIEQSDLHPRTGRENQGQA